MPVTTNKNDKLITWLLFVAVVSSVVGNLYAILQNENLAKNQAEEREQIEDAMASITDHNEAVEVHANDTATILRTANETLTVIEASLKNQTEVVADFNDHINITANNSAKLDRLLNQTATNSTS